MQRFAKTENAKKMQKMQVAFFPLLWSSAIRVPQGLRQMIKKEENITNGRSENGRNQIKLEGGN